MINWIFVTFLHVDPTILPKTLRELNKNPQFCSQYLGKQPQNIRKCFSMHAQPGMEIGVRS